MRKPNTWWVPFWTKPDHGGARSLNGGSPKPEDPEYKRPVLVAGFTRKLEA